MASSRAPRRTEPGGLEHVVVTSPAELDARVAALQQQGFHLQGQTVTSAQLVKRTELGSGRAIAAVLGFGPLGPAVTSVDIRLGAPGPGVFPELWPDGNWWWGRRRWNSTLRSLPPAALLSADGRWWWSGREWRPLPRGWNGLQQVPFTPGDIPPLPGLAPAHHADDSSPPDVISPVPVVRQLSTMITLLVVSAVLVWVYVMWGIELLLTPILLSGLTILLLLGLLVRALNPPPTLRLERDRLIARRRSTDWVVPWADAGPFLTDRSNRRIYFTAPQGAWFRDRLVGGMPHAQLSTAWFAGTADQIAAVLNERRGAASA